MDKFESEAQSTWNNRHNWSMGQLLNVDNVFHFFLIVTLLIKCLFGNGTAIELEAKLGMAVKCWCL